MRKVGAEQTTVKNQQPTGGHLLEINLKAPVAEESSVASLPIVMRMGFRLKFLALVTLNCIGILGIAIYCRSSKPIMDLVRSNYIIYQLFFLFMFGASMFFMAAAKENYPINYLAVAFFTICSGVWFGISDWGNNGNWQLLSYLSAHLLVYTILATRTWPSTCMGDSEAPLEDSPVEKFSCECVNVLMGNTGSYEIGGVKITMEGPKHIKGGRQIMFTNIAASSLAFLVVLIASIPCLVVLKYSDPVPPCWGYPCVCNAVAPSCCGMPYLI